MSISSLERRILECKDAIDRRKKMLGEVNFESVSLEESLKYRKFQDKNSYRKLILRIL